MGACGDLDYQDRRLRHIDEVAEGRSKDCFYICKETCAERDCEAFVVIPEATIVLRSSHHCAKPLSGQIESRDIIEDSLISRLCGSDGA